MQLADIDFAKCSIRIQAKGSRSRSHRHKQREILLPDAMWSALGDYLEVRAAPGQDRLWITWNKNPVTASGLNKIITRQVREAGIEKVISPHRLRATCTSLYVKKGVDPFFLKTLLGHRSIRTTMDHYATHTVVTYRSRSITAAPRRGCSWVPRTSTTRWNSRTRRRSPRSS